MDKFFLKNKTFIVLGVSNKKSIAFHIAQLLEQNEAQVIYIVHTEQKKTILKEKLLKNKKIIVCDVEKEKEIENLEKSLQKMNMKFDGFVHSIAFANYSGKGKAFHETKKEDFLQATDISCFSFIKISSILKDYFNDNASIITISISTTRMASSNYGYIAPIKAALDSSIVFLANSLAKSIPSIRVNGVGASLLKTNSSAGIPNYVKNYLYAEQVIPRKKALQTEEAAQVALFLLSPLSSGINAQTIIVDAGMNINYFDNNIIDKFLC